LNAALRWFAKIDFTSFFWSLFMKSCVIDGIRVSAHSFAQRQPDQDRAKPFCKCPFCREEVTPHAMLTARDGREKSSAPTMAPHFAHKPAAQGDPECFLRDSGDRYLNLPAGLYDPGSGERVRAQFFKRANLEFAYSFLLKAIGEKPSPQAGRALPLAQFHRCVCMADGMDLWSLKRMAPWKTTMLMATFFPHIDDQTQQPCRWVIDRQMQEHAPWPSLLQKRFAKPDGSPGAIVVENLSANGAEGGTVQIQTTERDFWEYFSDTLDNVPFDYHEKIAPELLKIGSGEWPPSVKGRFQPRRGIR